MRTLVTTCFVLLSGCFTPVEEYVPTDDGGTTASTPAPANFSSGAEAVPATLPSAPSTASDASTALPFDAGIDAGIVDAGLADAGAPSVFDAGTPQPVSLPPSGRQTVALTRVAGATQVSESSLAFKLDRAGSPVLAFVRSLAQRREVVVAEWAGTAWRETVIDSAPNAGGVSLAIDAHGTRHLAYSVTHPLPGQLKYARLSHDGGVVREVVLNALLSPPWPSTVTDLERTDLLAADNGEAHITYLRVNLPRVSSRTVSGSWNETVVATGHATLPRLVWSRQKPMVAVYFGFWTGLYLHERQGTTWKQTQVYNPAPPYFTLSDFSVSSGPDGGVRFAMAPEDQQRVLAGNSDPGEWSFTSFFPVVTGANPLSVGVSAMDVSPRQEIVVAYIGREPSGNTQFSIAELMGTTWTTHTIPGDEPRTSNLSLGIGPDRAPQLAWLANDSVRYWR